MFGFCAAAASSGATVIAAKDTITIIFLSMEFPSLISIGEHAARCAKLRFCL